MNNVPLNGREDALNVNYFELEIPSLFIVVSSIIGVTSPWISIFGNICHFSLDTQ